LKRGFTLIELLIVISIVALLVAMLLPALQTARDQAVRVQCASNQRQLYISLMIYAADYGDLPTYMSSREEAWAEGPGHSPPRNIQAMKGHNDWAYKALVDHGYTADDRASYCSVGDSMSATFTQRKPNELGQFRYFMNLPQTNTHESWWVGGWLMYPWASGLHGNNGGTGAKPKAWGWSIDDPGVGQRELPVSKSILLGCMAMRAPRGSGNGAWTREPHLFKKQWVKVGNATNWPTQWPALGIAKNLTACDGHVGYLDGPPDVGFDGYKRLVADGVPWPPPPPPPPPERRRISISVPPLFFALSPARII